MISSRDLSSQH